MRTPRLAIAIALVAFASCRRPEAAPPAPEPPPAPADAPAAESAEPPAATAVPDAPPAAVVPEATEPPPPPAVPGAAATKPKAAPAPTAAPPAPGPTAAPAPPPTAAPAPSPTAAPAPTAAPKAPPAPAAPVASAPKVVDPGGEVVVAATKPGLTRIGAEKCRVCHKVQHASWAASGHAKRNPPLDCEGCHGPGSEYKALAVMKDPKKARAAGLVDPDAAFCGKCHPGPWDPSLLAKAHAHKG